VGREEGEGPYKAGVLFSKMRRGVWAVGRYGYGSKSPVMTLDLEGRSGKGWSYNGNDVVVEGVGV
jgi:hypothetical protein